MQMHHFALNSRCDASIARSNCVCLLFFSFLLILTRTHQKKERNKEESGQSEMKWKEEKETAEWCIIHPMSAWLGLAWPCFSTNTHTHNGLTVCWCHFVLGCGRSRAQLLSFCRLHKNCSRRSRIRNNILAWRITTLHQHRMSYEDGSPTAN